jgi:hypothetical protein
MFAHHEIGIKHTIKSPHFPWGRYVVAIRGRNFKVRKRKTRKINK